MKTIGLIGGMSWESSQEYYRMINEAVKAELGGHHSAKCIMVSVDFHEIKAMQDAGDWEAMAATMKSAASQLQLAGADMVLICTNTLHKVAEEVQAAVGLPLVHIADAAAESILSEGLTKVGLLGTRFTMEEAFYRARLKERYGIEVIVPEADDRQRVHDIIFNELVLGEIQISSRNTYLEIISRLTQAGAQGVILGCTEIPLLVKPTDTSTRLFDTTTLHALQAVKLALNPA